MTTLEIRLLAYALLALILFGGSAWVGAHFTAKHYQAILTAQEAAQTQALVQAQQRVIDAQNAQKAAETAAENEHELRTQADAASRSAVLDSMRGLESAVRNRLSAAVANSGSVQAAQPSASEASAIAGLVERVNSSLDAFTAACQSVDNDRAAILSLQPKVTP